MCGMDGVYQITSPLWGFFVLTYNLNMPQVKVTVKGLRELQAKLNKIPQGLKTANFTAALEMKDLLLKDRGGGKPLYPPETEHNKPPVPYYIRGRGEQWAENYNDNKSEQMHTRFKQRVTNKVISFYNTASYADKVIGDNQKPFFRGIGWRALYEVAKSQVSQYAKIYEAKLKDIIKRLGL